MTSMPRLVSLAILTTLIVFLGITFYQIVVPFLLPLFLAAVTAVWCQPLFAYFQKKCRGRDGLAAAATITTVCLTLFIPMTIGVFSAARQLIQFVDSHKDEMVKSMKGAVERVRRSTSSDAENSQQQRREWATVLLDNVKPLPDSSASEAERAAALAERDEALKSIEAELQEASENAGDWLKEFGKKTLSWAAAGGGGLSNATVHAVASLVGAFVAFGMFLIAFYYFLCDGSKLMSATEKLIPVQVDYQRQLIHEFNSVMQAVVSATMLSAIAQGAATALALYIVGFHQFFLLFVVATFASLIPIAGTWMVWGPFAVWLCLGDNPAYGSAIFLAVVGVAVIGTMDNVIKAYVLQNDTSLHPLLAFVSVFGGMQVMGLWGIFIGPVVACCLHALLKIFNTELNEFSKERLQQPPSATIPTTPRAMPTTVPPTATPTNA
jgi:predicted PurR-regulated permease PerM